MSATGRGGDRLLDDAYTTQRWVIRALHFMIRMQGGGVFDVVDLGAGDGRIGVMTHQLYGNQKSRPRLVEIPTGLPHLLKAKWGEKQSGKIQDPVTGNWFVGDYLGDVHEQLVRSVRSSSRDLLVVSNPPYTLSLEFATRAIELISKCSESSQVWFLLRLNWLAAKKRTAFLNEHSPSFIGTLTPRPKFKSGAGTDACEYAWIMWKHPLSKRIGAPTFYAYNRYADEVQTGGVSDNETVGPCEKDG